MDELIKTISGIFDGKKTDLSGWGIVVAAIAYGMNYISMEQFLAMVGAFTGTGLLGLRSAVRKVEAKKK